MKLYTEEQVRKVWKAGQEYWKTSGASTTLEELLEHEKQIELPSEEEIWNEADNYFIRGQLGFEAAAVCPKCRTKDFDSCNSIRCPMRKVEETVKTQWDIRKCFEQLRFDKDHHLGLGDIRLTIGQQEEICELVERFYRCR